MGHRGQVSKRHGGEVGQLGRGTILPRGKVGLAGVVGAFLNDVADVIAGRYELEDAAVHLPVPELLRLMGIMSQVRDVQPVAEIIEHDAALAPESARGPGFPERLDFVDPELLAPVPGGGLEAELFGGRAGGEQYDVRLRRTDARLVRNPAVGCHQPVAHDSAPPAGRSQTCPSNRAMNSAAPGVIR